MATLTEFTCRETRCTFSGCLVFFSGKQGITTMRCAWSATKTGSRKKTLKTKMENDMAKKEEKLPQDRTDKRGCCYKFYKEYWLKQKKGR